MTDRIAHPMRRGRGYDVIEKPLLLEVETPRLLAPKSRFDYNPKEIDEKSQNLTENWHLSLD